MALTRDPQAILTHLTVTEDRGVVTKKACEIHIPERWLERHLASVTSEVYTTGIFAIVMGDVYATLFVDAMVELNPSNMETRDIGGEEYRIFQFEAGDRMIETLALMVNDTLTYYIYNELIAMGRMPWYVTYLDTPYVFESARKHAGINLGNPRILEFLMGTIYRDPKDMTVLYRNVLQSVAWTRTHPAVTIPFRSVVWNTSNTVSKLIGGYFNDSVTSALVNRTDTVEKIESLLRA